MVDIQKPTIEEDLRKLREADNALYEKYHEMTYEQARELYPDFPTREEMHEAGTWPGRFLAGRNKAMREEHEMWIRSLYPGNPEYRHFTKEPLPGEVPEPLHQMSALWWLVVGGVAVAVAWIAGWL